MSRTRFRAALAIAGLLLLPVAAPPAAAADLDFDIAAGISLSDDTRLFVNLSNSHYSPDPDAAVTLLHKVPHPGDDFPVLLFLAAESGRNLEFLWNLRRGGLSWAEVMFRLEVSPARLFAGIEHDPGPPYGKAWGHWKRRGARRAGTLQLADADFVDLVKVQITSKHFGLSPHQVLHDRSAGKKVETIAHEHHRKRAAGKPDAAARKTSHPGKGKGHKK